MIEAGYGYENGYGVGFLQNFIMHEARSVLELSMKDDLRYHGFSHGFYGSFIQIEISCII